MSEKAMAVQTAPEPAELKIVKPETLFERMEKLHEQIAKRAFQLFEGDGLFGQDLDHWFKAEAELLHPVHMTLSETEEGFEVKAEVPGFQAKELEISARPREITITGKREEASERKEKKTVYKEQCSNQIMRIIELPAEIDTAKITATLKDGVLCLTAPKGAQAKAPSKVEVKAA